ncbi:hypothetical protein FE257_005192 [Aspergillus nanangensis]|uniref:HTH araC/xylS-type domain-containing protein n=1 Tax=Aspergillus nanangensis TaxID=2582783 RepID=A0AAD4GVR8_ASPNN|nr:hypothetical protein FE257_005192 [Aspergillus nanangensis]
MGLSHSPPKAPRLITRNPQVSNSAAARWQAVISRDATVNHFVYAVLTTKIYCRPSCPGRLARRANVQFYDTPSQAELAGFRACKRCKPQTLRAVAHPHNQLMRKACATIDAAVRSGAKPTFRKLADEANLTPSHFHRVFKKTMGMTPGQYAAALVVRGSGKPLDTDGAEEDSRALFQSGGGLDLGGGGESCVVLGSGDTALSLWNDFDVLIAAEAGLVERVEGVESVDDFAPPVAVVDAPGATEILDWVGLLNDSVL